MFAMTDKDNTIILLVFCPEILRKYGLKGEMNKKEVLQKIYLHFIHSAMWSPNLHRLWRS